MTSVDTFLGELLAARLSPAQRDWLAGALRLVASLTDPTADAFPMQISLASRHVPRGGLQPTEREIEGAGRVLAGWNPERWSILDAARARLVLSRRDLLGDGVVRAVEECFRFADMGELVALYRAVPLIRGLERFAWRAGEGCRSSMRAVFEAAACDNPLPFRVFDDLAWRQLVIKALFVEAPLWRVHGLDQRLDPELARMALDLADERRSAGRPVRHELWACLGGFAGERGRAALEREYRSGNPRERRAAALGLARAAERETLVRLGAAETDTSVRTTIDRALAGHHSVLEFRALEAG